jgi:Protein of unknown function (DUF3275)
MYLLKGSLVVTEKSGRNGPFCVGKLATSIGEFVIKDSALDQFKPGTYDGSFLVTKIFQQGYFWRNSYTLELRASISPDGYMIDDEEAEQDGQAAPGDFDPLDESALSTQQSVIAQPAPAPVETLQKKDTDSKPSHLGSEPPAVDVSNAEPARSEATGLVSLFGIELASLLEIKAGSITLDPTVDREQFRKQRDHLKSVGYRFQSKTQTWTLENIT